MRWAWKAAPCLHGTDQCTHPRCHTEFIVYVRAFYAMNGDPVWRCKDGDRLLYSQMETSHVRNCLAAIERGHDRDGAKMRGKPRTVARLKLELAFRESAPDYLKTAEPA